MNAPETDRFRPSKEELSLFLEREFPQTKCRVVEVGNQAATIAHEIGEAELRPGGTVSGPEFNASEQFVSPTTSTVTFTAS